MEEGLATMLERQMPQEERPLMKRLQLGDANKGTGIFLANYELSKAEVGD